MISFNDYQILAHSTAIYPRERGLEYTILGLVGEAGELANHYKKVIRDKNGILHEEERQKLAKELGDCLWYIASVAEELHFDLEDIAERNLAKLAKRAENGTISGSGDDR